MELRQLKYFIKAAELQNFTDAAGLLYITQSTLSQQIKQLEDELKSPCSIGSPKGSGSLRLVKFFYPMHKRQWEMQRMAGTS